MSKKKTRSELANRYRRILTLFIDGKVSEMGFIMELSRIADKVIYYRIGL